MQGEQKVNPGVVVTLRLWRSGATVKERASANAARGEKQGGQEGRCCSVLKGNLFLEEENGKERERLLSNAAQKNACKVVKCGNFDCTHQKTFRRKRTTY